MQSTEPHTLEILAGHRFANLTTFRRNGQGVTTPVWFAQAGDTIYVMTQAQAGKDKRLRNNPIARIGPSDRAGKALGPELALRGRLLDPLESKQAARALGQKYGFQKKLFDVMFLLRGRRASQVYLAFQPANASG